MARTFTGLGEVERYLQDRIDRQSARIAAAKQVMKERRRGADQRSAVDVEASTAARRAYRDALNALKALTPISGEVKAVRLADDIVERVRKALEVIYATSQHGNHDFSDGADWSTVAGEAGDALNILNEARKETRL
jgi:hypothetical protein